MGTIGINNSKPQGGVAATEKRTESLGATPGDSVNKYFSPNTTTIAQKVYTPKTSVREKIINVETSHQNDQNNGEKWRIVEPTRKRRRQTCVGISKEKVTSINAVPRDVSLHVYRLNPDTTENDLKDYLKKDFPEVECTAMKSKYPEKYASFKVTLKEENFKKAMDPALWPYGTCVQRFLHLREKNTNIK